jgi:hypothetical protein
LLTCFGVEAARWRFEEVGRVFVGAHSISRSDIETKMVLGSKGGAGEDGAGEERGMGGWRFGQTSETVLVRPQCYRDRQYAHCRWCREWKHGVPDHQGDSAPTYPISRSTDRVSLHAVTVRLLAGTRTGRIGHTAGGMLLPSASPVTSPNERE